MTENGKEELGKAIRGLRTLRGLSHRQLAKRSGLQEDYLRGIERGERDVTFGALGLLAKGLGCSVQDLLREDARAVIRHVARTTLGITSEPMLEALAAFVEDAPVTPAPGPARTKQPRAKRTPKRPKPRRER